MNQDIDYFASLLRREYELAWQLHKLMEQEKDALADHNLQALNDLRHQSTVAIEQLRTQAGSRLQWMQHRQLPLSAACLDDPALQPATQLIPLWDQLESQYLHNRTLSETLAEVVLSARYRTQQKLKILRGQQNDPHLYNDKGEASRLRHGQGYIQV